MSIDVTVVVPVYNPGRYIEVLVDGVRSQTLPRDRFEVIFVDDGSTDETPARLDALAVEHEWISVIHQPNSGWPGKPRNVGLDAARGDYVFFSDHDDRLGPEALERMVATARRTGAEIVVPKMVNRGRGVPRGLFRTNNDDASLLVGPLSHSSVTPHKLFLRSWLNEHGLRYPEGRRRLEDGVFVTEAYLLATRISVLADYPCYYRYGRDDGGNAGGRMPNPKEYFGYLEEIIDVIDRHTEPGDELRRSLYQRPYSAKLLGKLFGKRMFSWTPEMREAVYREIRSVILRRFPADLAEDQQILPRAHLAALYADRLDQMVDIAGRTAPLVAETAVTSVKRTSERWTVRVSGEITFADGSPIRLFPTDGGWSIDERLIPAELSEAPYDEADLLRGAKVDMTVVHATEGVEWYLDGGPTPKLVPIKDDPDGAYHLVIRGTADLDRGTLAGGRPLDAGTWNLRCRTSSFGFTKDGPAKGAKKLGPRLGSSVLVLGQPPETLTLHRNKKAKTVALTVASLSASRAASGSASGSGSEPAPGSSVVKVTGNGRLAIPVVLADSSGPPPKLVVVVRDAAGKVVARRPAQIAPTKTGSQLTAALIDSQTAALPAGKLTVALKQPEQEAYVLGTVTVDRTGRVRGAQRATVVPPTLSVDRLGPTGRKVADRIERGLRKAEREVRRRGGRLRSSR